ncbi:hypothetical protein BZA05DRAFT_390844 [Tricharina praecox]|uniref:uncharacterized protein n=1 Tax=Tricharina praecox TaxID=43433 RepID=UPI00221E62AA|nr:uncharacterized protein BZA05DRAFT_390844 [Tricharina praecox]KAI5855198.1 hypothetical protein BZA05DRAFT_390844 [Tricharina praecox]
MQTSTLATLLLFVAGSLAAPQGTAATCTVTRPLILSLADSFTLQVQAPTASYHNASVQFTSVGTPGDYSAWLSPAGSPSAVKLTDSRLSLDHGSASLTFTGYLKVPIKTPYRQLGFGVSPTTELEVVGWYGCDENGVQQVVLGPAGGVWCVASDLISGNLGLFVKEEGVDGLLSPTARWGWKWRGQRLTRSSCAVRTGRRGGEVLSDGWTRALSDGRWTDSSSELRWVYSCRDRLHYYTREPWLYTFTHSSIHARSDVTPTLPRLKSEKRVS